MQSAEVVSRDQSPPPPEQSSRYGTPSFAALSSSLPGSPSPQLLIPKSPSLEEQVLSRGLKRKATPAEQNIDQPSFSNSQSSTDSFDSVEQQLTQNPDSDVDAESSPGLDHGRIPSQTPGAIYAGELNWSRHETTSMYPSLPPSSLSQSLIQQPETQESLQPSISPPSVSPAPLMSRPQPWYQLAPPKRKKSKTGFPSHSSQLQAQAQANSHSSRLSPDAKFRSGSIQIQPTSDHPGGKGGFIDSSQAPISQSDLNFDWEPSQSEPPLQTQAPYQSQSLSQSQ